MHKSAITCFLDCVRHLLIISGTATVMYLFGTRVHWLLPIISAIPVYVVMFYIADFLALPLYLLTPEHRVVSIVLQAIEEDDFGTALRVLRGYEDRQSVKLQVRPNIATIEGDEGQNAFVANLDDALAQDGSYPRRGNEAGQAELVSPTKSI